jgi:DNA (cytosine-5)-methyltransferase 1
MQVLYNEIDPFAAAWLDRLQQGHHIEPGAVDQRSIAELAKGDLDGFDQVHFFAGIGGWSLALRLAGWPTAVPVWTGSCPCQPFSSSGKRRGVDDERHLWPEMRRLIAECQPPIVFGEQVASNDGRAWLAGVRADLEALGYGVGAADLCAASIGAPHVRQRLFWCGIRARDGRLADAHGQGFSRHGRPFNLHDSAQWHHPQRYGAQGGVWHDAKWHPCLDGKRRRIPPQPEFFPVAHGISARVGRLRGYGNAIVPQVAAQFVAAVMQFLDLASIQEPRTCIN